MRIFGKVNSIAPLVKYLKDQNFKKISLIKTHWSYTEELSKALKLHVANEMILDEYSVSREENDFRTLILKIGRTKSDVLGIFLANSQISTFYQQQRQLKQNYPTFGSGIFASKKEILNAGSNIEGAVCLDYFYCDFFVNKYTKKFGVDDHIAYAVKAYDIVTIISKASYSSSKIEVSKIYESMKNAQSQDGICEKFRFKHSKEIGGYFEYQTALYQVKNGKVVKLK